MHNFALEGGATCGDNLDIVDSEHDMVLERLCGTISGETSIITYIDSLTVHFTSDVRGVEEGFNITYQSIDPSGIV